MVIFLVLLLVGLPFLHVVRADCATVGEESKQSLL